MKAEIDALNVMTSEHAAVVRSALPSTNIDLEELVLQFTDRRTQKRLRELETAMQSLKAMGLVEKDEKGTWG